MGNGTGVNELLPDARFKCKRLDETAYGPLEYIFSSCRRKTRERECILKSFPFVLTAVFCLGAPAFVFAGDASSRSVLLAQDTENAPADSAGFPDISPVQSDLLPEWTQPKTAMYHSMTLPGWGQFDNEKKKKAFLFIAAELAFAGGTLYEQLRLSEKNLTRFDKDVLRSNRNTWIIYWFGARVFGLVDAYVDAQMKGFNTRDIAPPDVNRPGSAFQDDLPDKKAPFAVTRGMYYLRMVL